MMAITTQASPSWNSHIHLVLLEVCRIGREQPWSRRGQLKFVQDLPEGQLWKWQEVIWIVITTWKFS